MRLFIAIDLDEEIKQQLSTLCGSLPGVKWTDADQFHLTLYFLGEQKSAEPIIELLEEIESPPFRLKLRGVGRFMNEKGGAIWAGIDQSQGLVQLHNSVGKVLRSAGYRLEKREYQPHITLGRIQTISQERLHDYLEHHAAFELEEFEVNEFTLFSSRLHPEGAVHKPEALFSLL